MRVSVALPADNMKFTASNFSWPNIEDDPAAAEKAALEQEIARTRDLLSSLLAVVYVWRFVEVAYFREPDARVAGLKEAPPMGAGWSSGVRQVESGRRAFLLWTTSPWTLPASEPSCGTW